jgi:hypothetical protein
MQGVHELYMIPYERRKKVSSRPALALHKDLVSNESKSTIVSWFLRHIARATSLASAPPARSGHRR